MFVAIDACADREESKTMKFGKRMIRRIAAAGAGVFAALFWVGVAQVQETVCARVKIEIKQELALE